MVNEFQFKARGLREIKKELDEVGKAINEATDPKQTSALVDKAKELANELGEVNTKLNDISKNKGMSNLSQQAKGLFTSFKELDFGGMVSKAKGFGDSLGKISFKNIIKGVKDLGSVFMAVGRALLTNPVFLLATAVVIIVSAIAKLLDSLGLLTKALELSAKPLNFLIGLFDKFTDAIGLTNKAEIKAYEESAKRYEEKAKIVQEASNDIIQAIEHEIRMNELEGKDVEKLEKLKRDQLEETAKEHLKAAQAKLNAARVNKEIDKEELKQLEDKLTETRLFYQKTLQDTRYFEAKIAQEKKDKQIKEDFDKDQERKKDAEKRRNDYQKKLAEEKRYQEERQKLLNENAQRLIQFNRDQDRIVQDLQIDLMQEGAEKQISQNRIRVERLIEDTKNEYNELILLNQDMADELLDKRNKIIEYYSEQLINKEVEIWSNDSKRIVKAVEEAQGLITYTYQSNFQQREAAIYADNRNRLKLLKDDYNNQLIEQSLFNEAKYALEQDLERRLKELREQTDKEILDARLNNINNYVNAMSQGINAIGDLVSASYENEINAAKGNTEQQEELRKKAFESQKKFQIAAALMNMAQGIVAGLGSPWPMNLIQPIMAGLTGASQIAKIKATQYNSTNSGGSGASTPSVSSPDTSRNTPNINFTGTGGSSTYGASGQQPINNNNEIFVSNNISVSEYDITSTQNRVAKIKESASI
jgi:hypothetical protein